MSWLDKIKDFVKLAEGTTVLNIINEPNVTLSQKFNNERLMIPTHLGIWGIGLNSPVARALKSYALEHNGKLKGTTITITRIGSDSNTRYKLEKIEPTQTKESSPAKKEMSQPQIDSETLNFIKKYSEIIQMDLPFNESDWNENVPARVRVQLLKNGIVEKREGLYFFTEAVKSLL